jgi:hypothetical protein
MGICKSKKTDTLEHLTPPLGVRLDPTPYDISPSSIPKTQSNLPNIVKPNLTYHKYSKTPSHPEIYYSWNNH